MALTGSKGCTNDGMPETKAEPWAVDMAVEMAEHCDRAAEDRNLRDVRLAARPEVVAATPDDFSVRASALA
jgi:hypothetical protein